MGHPAKKHIHGIGESSDKAPLLDRLIFWKRDLPAIIGVSTRTIDRWISSGEFPRADVTISGKSVWRRETVKDWSGAPRG